MTTVLNRDSIKVKRDLQRRVENWVIEYCDALEENFKQYSINGSLRTVPSSIPNLFVIDPVATFLVMNSIGIISTSLITCSRIFRRLTK